MAEVTIPTLGEPVDTGDWDVKGFPARWRDQSFLILVDGSVMQRVRERSYAVSRIAPSIWSMSEKTVLEEAASRKLHLEGMPEDQRLRLSPADLDKS